MMKETTGERNERLFIYGRITEHFDWGEMTESSRARWKAIHNIPDDDARTALKSLCTKWLEPLRSALGRPVVINSGYRCPALNAAVGGAPHSLHMQGRAVDILGGSFEEARRIAYQIKVLFVRGVVPAYDELFLKSGKHSWYVHLGVSADGEPGRLRDNLQDYAEFRRILNQNKEEQ